MEGRKKLHCEQFNNFYYLSNIINETIPRRMRCCTCGQNEKYIGCSKISVRKPEEKSQLEKSRSRREVRKWVLGEWDGKIWTELIWVRMESRGGLLHAMNNLVP
jgi:hypothetical protein